MAAMLSLEEAQARALALVPSLPLETLPTGDALGRYLAEDLRATRTQPPADLSAMDGYAIGCNGPWELIGESSAGHPFDGAIGPGQCIRISTGAHVPQGADRVLIQENAAVDGAAISCTVDMPDAGKHVRKRGFDFSAGDRLLAAGTRLGPAQVALALGGGHAEVSVITPPSIAVIDSGDELASDASNCGPNQIPASNGAMLAAMLQQLSCNVTRIGPVPDSREALDQALTEAASADLVVTSGGASVGDHDLVRPALENWGASIDFWKVAIKPGKPLMIATRGQQAIFGLPGNPVSSFVTAFLFVLPFVRAALGAAEPLPRQVTLKAGCDLPEVGSRREFLRGFWDGDSVRLSGSQDSSALAALAASNVLIDRSAGAAPVVQGEAVPCYLLENG